MIKNLRNRLFPGIFLCSMMFFFTPCQSQQLNSQSGWPQITKETKPWTRWWWMGSAVNEANLSSLISEYGKAGFGGVEITPIYGAVGYESQYLKYLSHDWMNALDVSVREAGKIGMGVDMNTGTGWPLGGPQISVSAAASKLIIQKYSLPKGAKLVEKLIVSDKEQKAAGVRIYAVTAYNSDGKVKDLTDLVDQSGTLNWIDKESDWELYAAFCGKTLQKVKRAAPGAEGLTLDHFSKEALDNYLSRFDSAFQKSNHGVRSFFNDSYEVYGTNWTSSLFNEFQKRRGYSLQPYLRELAEKVPSSDISRRVQCDYRETISDLLLENFTQHWTKWANNKGSLTRNQAHGSPGNLLDIYAAVDIAECETFGSSHFDIPGLRRDSSDIRNVDPDPVMLKFASSATNVSGKKLTSSETFTWLSEHFRVSLSQCKPEVEQAFLSGVNHVFYHGTAYSPSDVAWPGWLFYASVNFSPSNSFWPHISGLNNYITRCQSVLQSGVPQNDLLVYWPVYDVWMNPENIDLQLTIHSIDKWLYPSPFYKDVKMWMKEGYSLDFVSDRLLNEIEVKNGQLVTKSGSVYRTLVIPESHYIPQSTLKRIFDLAQKGALVVFEQFPVDVPGLSNLELRRKQNKDLLSSLVFKEPAHQIKIAKTGKGEIILARHIQSALEMKNISRETLVDLGLKYIRRKDTEGVYYFLANHTSKTIDRFLDLNSQGNSFLLLDPQTGFSGMAQKVKNKVRVQLRPGEAIIVLVSQQKMKAENWKYIDKSQSPFVLNGPWKLNFTKGGEVIPASLEISQLISWTDLPDSAAQNFSGTARYTTTFELPDILEGEYLLDLGKICESAQVWINGHDAGILWSIPFTARIGKFLHPGINTIDIEVANLMANRIRQMDQKKVVWRNYHEINFVNIDYKPFDASGWRPMPSGLLGPVNVTPILTVK
jgi:hypothetical protein